MATYKELTDFDLDVMNATKDFPLNEKDAYIYIRSEDIGKQIKGFIATSGDSTTLAQAMALFIDKSEKDRGCVFDAVISYLRQKENKLEKKQFVRALQAFKLF